MASKFQDPRPLRSLERGRTPATRRLIAFTLTGWAFCETRFLHLTAMVLVGISWLGLGLSHGLGYCLLTDIQWRLKERMGEERPTAGCMKFLADRLSGRDCDAKLVDAVTYITCILCCVASLLLTLTAGVCKAPPQTDGIRWTRTREPLECRVWPARTELERQCAPDPREPP